MARTILVVEDETTLRETLADALEVEGFRVIAAPTAAKPWIASGPTSRI
jgi:DNA-binding response OmpR family regulator